VFEVGLSSRMGVGYGKGTGCIIPNDYFFIKKKKKKNPQEGAVIHGLLRTRYMALVRVSSSAFPPANPTSTE
jgi:hypothetical protein